MTDGPHYQLWLRNDARCEAAIRDGAPLEVALTAYGLNDFALEWLMSSGLWTICTGMVPDDLRKGNGHPWRALNGVEVLRELARVSRIAHCGKILHDVRLMAVAGFNVEALRQRKAEGPLIDPETLSNHLARISVRSAQRTWWTHVRHLRTKRWLRGKVYAADAHEITLPYGRHAERLGRIGEAYGFKLVLLMNIAEERERLVGFALAPLQVSERQLLWQILWRLERHVAPVRKLIDVLIMDRGYWGAKYLTALHARWGCHYVTRLRDEALEVVHEVDVQLALLRPPWQTVAETRSRLGSIQVKVVGLDDVPLRDAEGEVLATTNIVVAEEYDQTGQRLRDERGDLRPRMLYAASFPTAPRPYRARQYYLRRWLIENQGFRELTQQWHLDTLVGHSFQANHARLAFVGMLYNAERILRMKHPGPWQEERERLRWVDPKTLMGGLAVVGYTPQGQLGLWSVKDYGALVQAATHCAVQAQLVGRLKEAYRHGQSLEDVLKELGG